MTATVDWCEPNYVVTFYIAEFWNTISNLAFILVSALGLRPRHDLEWRFILSYWGLLAVGVGSTMFHMTLRYEYQLLDELPMM